MKISRCLVLLEITLVYSLIQLYIWRWQFTHPAWAWLIFLFLISTHLWHKETILSLGFRYDNLISALKLTGLVSLPLVLLLFFAGTSIGRIWALKIQWSLLSSMLRYILWAIFQEYGLQGFFHHRLMRFTSNPILSSVVNAFIFMSLHIPNPVLMSLTLLGGFGLSMIYTKEPNIFALGIFHGLVGLLLSNSVPKALLPNMRVGPGYFR